MRRVRPRLFGIAALATIAISISGCSGVFFNPSSVKLKAAELVKPIKLNNLSLNEYIIVRLTMMYSMNNLSLNEYIIVNLEIENQTTAGYFKLKNVNCPAIGEIIKGLSACEMKIEAAEFKANQGAELELLFQKNAKGAPLLAQALKLST